MLVSKKARLIWDEQYLANLFDSQETASRCIDPNVSFDGGTTWMSLGDVASTLRLTGSSSNGSSISGSTSNEGFNQLDITFGFTPYGIAEITNAEYYESDNDVFVGGQTYYFAIMSTSYDLPGFYSNEKDDADYYLYYSGNYYNGPTNGTLDEDIDKYGYYPISKVYNITLPGDSNTKYGIRLYIRYPEICKGLCVYYGQASGSTLDLKLCTVTNLVQRLGEDIIGNSSTEIVLENNYPLPPSGMVLIDGETISYTSCTYDSGKNKWVLRANPALDHSANTSDDNNAETATRVYLAQYTGGSYGELPIEIYPKVTIDENCVQYINFDSQECVDLAENTNPTTIGSVGYDQISSPLVNSFRLTSSGGINTNLMNNETKIDADALNAKGSIQFYMMLSNFTENDTTDPYVFMSYNPQFGEASQGLWMRISRFNLKPYIGYSYYNAESKTLENIDIANFEDYRMPSITRNRYSLYTITWETIEKTSTDLSANDAKLNYMRFTYIVDGTVIMTIDSTIYKDQFEVGNLIVGGNTSNASTITNSFIGYIDEWRVYAGRTLSREDTIEINRNTMQQNGIQHSGRITLSASTIVDYSNPNINGTGTNSLTGTLATKYEPKLYTSIKLDNSEENRDNIGKEYGTYYDSWFINAYNTDGRFDDLNNYLLGGGQENNYVPLNATYPINADTIKVKFDMIGPNNGFSSPRIKNIMLMVSEATLD